MTVFYAVSYKLTKEFLNIKMPLVKEIFESAETIFILGKNKSVNSVFINYERVERLNSLLFYFVEIKEINRHWELVHQKRLRIGILLSLRLSDL